MEQPMIDQSEVFRIIGQLHVQVHILAEENQKLREENKRLQNK